MKIIGKQIMIAAAMLAMVSCAAVGPQATPTGNPEVTIKTGNATSVKGALVSALSNEGYQMVNDGQFNMSFVKQLDAGTSALYTVLAGNAYSSQPNFHVSFSIVPGQGSTHVYGHVGVDMQGVFGQNQGTMLDHGKAGHQLQNLLELVKAQVEDRA
jgi:hypothetical protein